MKGKLAATILRWGLAFVFFYAAIASLRSPADWAIYLPGWLIGSVPIHPLMVLVSIVELILAAWLFIGRKLAWAALVSMIALALSSLVNYSLMDIVFRDIGLALAALALYELAREKDFKEEDEEEAV